MSVDQIKERPHGLAILLGIAMTLSSNFFVRFVNLAITILLARAVAPEGMGVVAAALLCIEIVDTARDLGVREALIYQPERRRSLLEAGFAITLILASIQVALLLAVAPAGGLVVDSDSITPVLIVLALLFPINALGVVQQSLLQKDLRFGGISTGEIAGVLVKAAVAFTLLAADAGIWSLVIAVLAGAAARTTVYWILSDWRPRRLRPEMGEVRRLIRYGRHIFYVNVMSMARLKADQIVILLGLGDAALGIYYVAARIPEIAIFGVNVAITKVIFPAYARIAHDRVALARAYLDTIRGCMAVMAPVSIGLAMVADPLVPLLFGDDWLGAVPILQVLVLSGIPLTLGWSAGDVFKSTGRPELLTRLYLRELSVTVPLVCAAAFGTGELALVAMAMVAGECAASGFRLWFMQRYEGVTVRATLGVVVRPLAAALTMAAFVWMVSQLSATLPSYLRLAAEIATGVLVYAAALAVVDRRTVRDLRRLRGHAG